MKCYNCRCDLLLNANDVFYCSYCFRIDVCEQCMITIKNKRTCCQECFEEMHCSKCNVNIVNDKFAMACDTCKKICCSNCIAFTGCQTTFGLCGDCYDYRCSSCDGELDRSKNYLDDGDRINMCEDCKTFDVQ
jgi:hypothetical protein